MPDRPTFARKPARIERNSLPGGKDISPQENGPAKVAINAGNADGPSWGAEAPARNEARTDAGLPENDARIRSFAEHCNHLLWIVDPSTGTIEYRSPAYEQIWGESRGDATRRVEEWLGHVHPDDVERVRRAMRLVEEGDVAQVEYRITRRSDGEVRWLRDTSFPIRDRQGNVVRIGGIAEDMTRHDGKQVYIVGGSAAEGRRLAGVLRGLRVRVRTFAQAEAFLDIAPFLTPGCVLVDQRGAARNTPSIATELRTRSLALKVIVIGSDDADIAAAVNAMKAGAADYLNPPVTDAALIRALDSITTDSCAPPAETAVNEAAARVARLSPREREVLKGLVEGGTNKTIGIRLGISPRTVELHRGQIMAKLNASNLAALVQLALTAGLRAPHR